MKSALRVIKDLVKKYPNDMKLGLHVRHFIRQLEKASSENKS